MAIKRITTLFCLLLLLAQTQAESLHIAVTASFRPVLDELAIEFEKETGIALTVSSASTGTLYQQSLHGAPFDVFLSADKQRPRALQEKLKLSEESVFIYAKGELVFVSTDPGLKKLEDILQSKQRVIIANAKVAPFGVAAEQVLVSINYQGEKVLANNVMQAQQYLNLRLAPTGIVSASVALNLPSTPIPQSLYEPVEQAGVVLNDTPVSQTFVKYLTSPKVLELYQKYGYSMADSTH